MSELDRFLADNGIAASMNGRRTPSFTREVPGADLLASPANSKRPVRLWETTWLRQRRRILKELQPADVLRANVEATQENFDIAVEEANLPLVRSWKKQYNFTVDAIPAIRSNNAELLDMVEEWSDPSGYDFYDPQLEEVARVRNFYYLEKFRPDLSPEFVKAGWLEGVAEVLERIGHQLDYDIAMESVVTAINYQQWDCLRLILSTFTDQQKILLATDLQQDNYSINDYQSAELAKVLSDFNVVGW